MILSNRSIVALKKKNEKKIDQKSFIKLFMISEIIIVINPHGVAYRRYINRKKRSKKNKNKNRNHIIGL